MEKNISLLSENNSTLNWEYTEDFKAWLRDVSEHEFDYVAAMTRRGPNIIELLLQESTELKDFAQTFTTESGLLMQAEKIARNYVDTGVFPSIVILDDILVHGRSLNEYVDKLQSLLVKCIRKIDESNSEGNTRSEIDTELIESEFHKSLTLWMYAINDAPFFLKQKYQWRLRYQRIWPESEWRKLSNSIAKYIRSENIANTSYVISAYVKATNERSKLEKLKSSWIIDTDTSYCEGNQTFYLFRNKQAAQIYPTVRKYKRKNNIYYTPYFFTGKVEASQVMTVLRRIVEYMSAADKRLTNKIVQLFNRIGSFSDRLNVYCQLFYLLLSQITLNVFLLDCGYSIDDSTISYDYNKICRNFGCAEDVGLLFEDLCKVEWSQNLLIELVCLLNNLNDAGINIQTKEEYQGVQDFSDVVKTIEDKIYLQALEHEAGASALMESGVNKESGPHSEILEGEKLNNLRTMKRTGERPVEEFLCDILNERKISIGPSTIASILSCMTQMMDRGDISLKARAEQNNEKKWVFYSAVRNTEMSLSIMPRRIKEIYPDFFRVAQFYWREDDFPERVSDYFSGRSLQDGSSDDINRHTKYAIEFAGLIRNYRGIVDSMLNWKNICEEL